MGQIYNPREPKQEIRLKGFWQCKRNLYGLWFLFIGVVELIVGIKLSSIGLFESGKFCIILGPTLALILNVVLPPALHLVNISKEGDHEQKDNT